ESNTINKRATLSIDIPKSFDRQIENPLKEAAMGQMITFKRPDGKECNGYLATSAQVDKAPGVVVIQEWWGLNDQIKGVADKPAGLGYRALVPDLDKGKVTLDAPEAQHLMTNLD